MLDDGNYDTVFQICIEWSILERSNILRRRNISLAAEERVLRNYVISLPLDNSECWTISLRFPETKQLLRYRKTKTRLLNCFVICLTARGYSDNFLTDEEIGRDRYVVLQVDITMENIMDRSCDQREWKSELEWHL